jgi:putative peptide zinc metalloprotease protein
MRPALAPHVQLLGEMQGTGFKEPQWLLRRHDHFIQLTELLYRIAERADGVHTLEEIATEVTEATDWLVSAENVRQLLQTKLIPLGLIAPEVGAVLSQRETGGESRMLSEHRTSSPLRVNMRMKGIKPRHIEPIAKVLQVLHAPPVLIPLLIAIAIAHGWVYLMHGITGSLHAAFYTPGLWLAVLAIMIVAGIFHEFGHASALQYGGGKVRGMGVGLYLIYPAFYTDVTDSYRLGRWARVHTDLGGFYFHLIFALGLIALYIASGQEFLLIPVLLINLNILYQCLPFVRFDGYWALADLTGVSDFFSQIGPFLRSILPRAGQSGGKLPELKSWVKGVFTAYILFTIPVLSLFVLLMVARFPAMLVLTWDSARIQLGKFSYAQGSGEVLGMVEPLMQMLVLALMLSVSVYLLYSVSRTLCRTLWHWSKPSPLRRTAGACLLLGVVWLIGLLWTPYLSYGRSPTFAGLQRFEITERAHIQGPVVYPQIPPVGGSHAAVWQNCGFYDRPVANENAVHSLEHGAVWITYRADVPPAEVEWLRQLVRHQPYVLVSLFPEAPAPVVVSAWGHQLQLASSQDPRLGQFVRQFRLSTQAPERGGPCTAGIGTPQR